MTAPGARGNIFLVGSDIYAVLAGLDANGNTPTADGTLGGGETVLKLADGAKNIDPAGLVDLVRTFFGAGALLSASDGIENVSGVLGVKGENPLSEDIQITLSDLADNYARVTIGRGEVQAAGGAGALLKTINTDKMTGTVRITGLNNADPSTVFTVNQDASTSEVLLDVTGAPKNVSISSNTDPSKAIVTGTLGSAGVTGAFTYDADGVTGAGNTDALAVANGTLAKTDGVVTYTAKSKVGDGTSSDSVNLRGSLSALTDASTLSLVGAQTVSLTGDAAGSIRSLRFDEKTGQTVFMESGLFNTLSAGIQFNRSADKIILTDADPVAELRGSLSLGTLTSNDREGSMLKITGENVSIYDLNTTGYGIIGFEKLHVSSGSHLFMTKGQFTKFSAVHVSSDSAYSNDTVVTIYDGGKEAPFTEMKLGSNVLSDYSHYYGVLHAGGNYSTRSLKVDGAGATVDLQNASLSNFTHIKLGNEGTDDSTSQRIKLLSASFTDVKTVYAKTESDEIILTDTDSIVFNVDGKFSDFNGLLRLSHNGSTVSLSESCTIECGNGSDTLSVAPTCSKKSDLAWIRNFSDGDGIRIVSPRAVKAADMDSVQTAVASAIAGKSGDVALAAALDAAAGANTVDNTLMWFACDGASYAYIESTGSETSHNAEDFVIKVTGTTENTPVSFTDDNLLLSAS